MGAESAVSVRLRRGKPNEWTLFRQLAGNVVPFIHWLPTFILAWLLIDVFGGSAFMVLLVLLGVFSSLTFGTWALFDNTPRLMTAVAIDDGILLKIVSDTFYEFLADHEEVTPAIFRAVIERVKALAPDAL